MNKRGLQKDHRYLHIHQEVIQAFNSLAKAVGIPEGGPPVSERINLDSRYLDAVADRCGSCDSSLIHSIHGSRDG